MTLEMDKINSKELDIKEVNGITFISTKIQDHSAEQIVVYAEHEGKKYLAIAPRTVKEGLNTSFRYTSLELLATVIDIAKIKFKKTELGLGTHTPGSNKIKWESKPIKEPELNLIKHIENKREEVKAKLPRHLR